MKIKHFALLLPLLLFVVSCNGQETPISTSKSINYAGLGASDAFGVGADPRENGYVWLIADWLATRFDSVGLQNDGIPGATADLMLALEVPAAISYHPGAVTLWTGPNDIIGGRSLDAFDSDLDGILSRLAQETQAQVFVANVPDLTLLPKFQQDPDPDVTQQRVAAFNGVIASRAAQHAAYVVDLYSTAIAHDPIYVSGDGFHPSNAGHRLIADTFVSIMSAALPAGELARHRLLTGP